MEPTDLRELLETLGLSQADFARLIDVTPRAVNLWTSADRAIPGPVAAYLRLLASIPAALRAQEFSRLTKEAIVTDGMFEIVYQGRTGAGTGVLVLMAGRVFGSDGGVLYDGTYEPSSSNSDFLDVYLRCTVPPGIGLVTGVPPQKMTYSFDLSAKIRSRGETRVKVETPYGPVGATVRFLREVPRDLAA